MKMCICFVMKNFKNNLGYLYALPMRLIYENVRLFCYENLGKQSWLFICISHEIR